MNHNRFTRIFINSAKKILPVLFLLAIQFKTSAQVQTQRAVSTTVSEYIKGYYESLPVDYSKNTTKKYPLLIFLHGRDERGNGTTQLPRVLKNGIPKLLSKGQFPSSFRVGGKDFSFIVISPQYASSSDYVTSMWKLIEYCKKKYRVDASRIYITGLSMGGLLAWNFAGASKDNADAFAAMVTVTGGGVPTAGRIANIASAKLPVWATNNSGDPYNPASRARETVNALNAYRPAPPKALLTIFQKAGHDAWTQSYDPNFRQGGLNVYEWMLSYTNNGTSQPAPEPAPPVAKAGANQTITLPVNSVTLSGSGSSASSGTIKSYSWKKISGPTQGGLLSSLLSITTKVTGLVVGVYKFELTVKDSNGNSAKSTVTVTVNPAVAKAPTAKAGSNQTITLPASSVTVNASASTADAGAKIKSYTWTKKSGPAAGKITSAGSVKTTITGLTIAGTYQFQVKVTDDKGKSATSVTTIVVKPAPIVAAAPPTAKAGANQTITLPASSVTVNAGASAAASGAKINAFAWSKKSGPAAGKISSAGSAKTTITGLTIAGTYQFQVKVTDNKGKSAVAVTTIVVKPAPAVAPVAKAGADQTITVPATSVKLDGSRSTASAGKTIKSYAWRKVSGPYGADLSNPSGSTSQATELVPGTYVFRLTVKDNDGKTGTDDVKVIVKYKSGSLKANAGGDQTFTYPLETSPLLNGGASTAPAGGAISCEWKRIAGPGSYGAVLYPSGNLITHASKSLAPGVYKYELIVRDAKGNESSDVMVLTVKSKEPEVVLKADAGNDQTITIPTSSIKLDGSGSTMAKGSSVKRYVWTKVGGPAYSGHIVSPNSASTVVNNLDRPGVYTFRLKIVDNNNKEETDDVVVRVNFKSGALNANAGPDQTLRLPLDGGIVVNGNGSTTPNGSSNGIHVAWSRVSGPGGYGAVLYPSSNLTTNTSKALVPGVYQFRLTLTDTRGNTSTDIVKVTVKAATSGRIAGEEEVESVVTENNIAPEISKNDLELKINPNPVTTNMTLWITGSATGKTSVLVYNLQGGVLMQQEFLKDAPGAVSKSFDVSKLPAGAYLVQVIVDGKHRKSMQMIKQ
ncbi:MAG: PKD domain-containing protein [Agriterribacter sp.]